MRGKIIAVFAVVVLVIGGLSYALTRVTLGDLSTSGEAPRALAAASAQLQLDGLVLERWLASQATDPKLREPFNAALASARAEGATTMANKIHDAAGTPELASVKISLVALVDKKGIVVGRNGSALMRGDDLGAVYPPLKAAMAKGVTGSDVWVNRARNEQMLASYAPIRDGDGNVVGAVVVGTALNDERLTNASERTSGRALVAAAKNGDALDIVAKSNSAGAEVVAALAASPAKDAAFRAIGTSQVTDVGGLPHEFAAAAQSLEGYGDGHRLVLISISHEQGPAILGSLLLPAIGVTILGLVLVVIGAYFLDVYISRPISEIEDGLLAIMNGRTDRRFEIEHAELGGLVFRLNSLLNQLFGVQEDETDDQGRPSRAPAASSFQDALSVDESMASLSADDHADAKALRDEAEESYYPRVFAEYIAAKTSLGDPVDHITQEAFTARIKVSEAETAAKQGKPVRYKVEVRGREVVLLAVPLV
jgi:HAMP domain-containing protein